MTSADPRRNDSNSFPSIPVTRDRKPNATTRPMLEMLVPASHELAHEDRHRLPPITADGRYFRAGVEIGTMDPDRGLGSDAVTVDANQALAIGLVQSVHPAVELPARARAFAEERRQQGPTA